MRIKLHYLNKFVQNTADASGELREPLQQDIKSIKRRFQSRSKFSYDGRQLLELGL